MQNYTITFLSVVSIVAAILISRKWLVRQRQVKNRFGLSLGKLSIGFHFGKWSAYAFPASGRTLNQKLLKVA